MSINEKLEKYLERVDEAKMHKSTKAIIDMMVNQTYQYVWDEHGVKIDEREVKDLLKRKIANELNQIVIEEIEGLEPNTI